MPKAPQSTDKVPRHSPLGDQLTHEGKFRTTSKSKENRLRARQVDEDEENATGSLMSEKVGKKILTKVANHQREIESEMNDEDDSFSSTIREKTRAGLDMSLYEDDDACEIDENEEYDEVEYEFSEKLSDQERRALELFLPSKGTLNDQLNIGNLIEQKVREREEQMNRGIAPAKAGEVQMKSVVDPQVVEVYRQVGQFMKKYTSGKIPKPFKLIPSLKNWEEILYFTEPDEWSPQATHAATRLFAANLNPLMAQRFFSLVLLPRVLKDIDEHGKLNFHFYEALRRALFKPTAFFKGIILPVAEGGCFAKQALIFSSILGKSSIPVLHSSVALLKLSQMPYNGPQTLFMKTLLGKKYALPIPVINSISDYFAGFIHDGREFPLLFYQALLTFVQRYKTQLTPEQKAALRAVVNKKPHGAITTEIRRELLATVEINA